MLIKLIKENKLIILILTFALILRLFTLNQSLWLDESIGAIAVKNFSYQEMFTKFIINDNHPPLYYLILKVWSGIFGYTEVSMRFPSLLFGLGTLYLTYIITKRLTDNKNKYFPIISAILISTSQFHIYYSQEARMYSQAAFFAALAVFSFISIIKQNKRNFYWVLFSFSITSMIFTDYMPIFLLPVFWLYGIVSRQDKRWWIAFVVSHIPLIVFFIAWLPLFIIQSRGGKWLLETLPAWKSVAGGANLKQALLVWTKFSLGRISLANKKLYYLLIVVSSIPFALAFVKTFFVKRKLLIIWFWLIIPLLLGFLASFLFPAFIYFRFLYVLPAFYILISWGISNLIKHNLKEVLLIILVLINVGSWIIYIKDPFQQREAWKKAVSFIELNAKPNDVVIFEYPEPFTPFRWYTNGKVNAVGVTDSISADPIKTVEITKETIQNKTGIYYFEYLRDLTDPQRVVEKEMEAEDFKVAQVYNFVGVGQVYYWTK